MEKFIIPVSEDYIITEEMIINGYINELTILYERCVFYTNMIKYIDSLKHENGYQRDVDMNIKKLMTKRAYFRNKIGVVRNKLRLYNPELFELK